MNVERTSAWFDGFQWRSSLSLEFIPYHPCNPVVARYTIRTVERRSGIQTRIEFGRNRFFRISNLIWAGALID